MSPRKSMLASSLAAVIGAGALLGAPAAFAYTSIQNLWGLWYPDSLSGAAAADEQGNYCALCHLTEQGNGFNPYGDLLRVLIPNGATNQEINEAFVAAEPTNSDMDPGGCANVAEIDGSSQPGWTVGDIVPPPLEGNLLDLATPCVPDIEVDPLAVNYGTVYPGTNTPAEITVRNVGGQTLTIENLTLTGDPVFSLGQSVPAVPFDIGPSAAVTVGVVFSPLEFATTYTGALVIDSTDPDEDPVEVTLTGDTVEGGVPCALLADPDKLNFGQLIYNEESLELGSTVTNIGDGTCEAVVSVPQCVDGEFTLTSPAAITLGPMASTEVTAVYAPINIGLDNCRIDIVPTTGFEIKIPMEGEGVSCKPTDLDIEMFRTQANTSISRSDGRVFMDIIVQNNGTDRCPGQLTVTGVLNGGDPFVHQVVSVYDSPDTIGPTRYRLQTYFATEVGLIEWTATLVDGDPDVDEATALTNVRP